MVVLQKGRTEWQRQPTFVSALVCLMMANYVVSGWASAVVAVVQHLHIRESGGRRSQWLRPSLTLSTFTLVEGSE